MFTWESETVCGYNVKYHVDAERLLKITASQALVYARKMITSRKQCKRVTQ